MATTGIAGTNGLHGLQAPTNATGLIAVLEELTLQDMTKKESDQLHEMLESVRIDIEQRWMDWDS